MYRRLVLLTGGLILLGIPSLSAEDAVLEKMFGNGVHVYFSRDYSQAHEYLTRAIDGGYQDPRCFYFRGLAYLKLGREDEAKADFQEGAKRETEDINKFYNVSKSLERIQGKKRLMLETYRADARMAALEKERTRRALRYEEIRQQESRVLQRQVEEAPAVPVPPKPPGDDGNPFGVEPVEVKPAEKPAPAAEAKPAPAAPEKPAPAAEAEKPAEAKPAEPAPAPAAPPKPVPPAEAEKPEAKPAADDPFATDPAAPAAKEAKPAAPAAKPAAAEEKPLPDDPFAQ